MRREERSHRRALNESLLARLLWLLLVCGALYLCLIVIPDLATDRLYDLVWAAVDT